MAIPAGEWIITTRCARLKPHNKRSLKVLFIFMWAWGKQGPFHFGEGTEFVSPYQFPLIRLNTIDTGCHGNCHETQASLTSSSSKPPPLSNSAHTLFMTHSTLSSTSTFSTSVAEHTFNTRPAWSERPPKQMWDFCNTTFFPSSQPFSHASIFKTSNVKTKINVHMKSNC